VGPVLWASLRNGEYRKYKYSGFSWSSAGCFITEELIGKEETVNNKGELVIVENRERRLNLEVEDETGFTTQLCRWSRPPSYCPGQVAEMLVLSKRSKPDCQGNDIYIPVTPCG